MYVLACLLVFVPNSHSSHCPPLNHPPSHAVCPGNGHGTHTSGTVGGRTVGVAPGASVFMSKILDDSGEGSTAVVLAALEVVQAHFLARRTGGGGGAGGRRPAVLSLSLGGSCDQVDSFPTAALACAHDPIGRQEGRGGEGVGE